MADNNAAATHGHLARVDQSTRFEITSSYSPRGDQPRAIETLVSNLQRDIQRQVLLGVTGSGKTFTMANVIEQTNRPALVLAHNKTLAAQLYSEFRELFGNNSVRYFVSYYDYYQPEAYVPSTDTFIEKDSAINDEIDKLRHAATKGILERRDVVVVASVSCIYGLGDPQMYFESVIFLEKKDRISRDDVLRRLVGLQFTRNEIEFEAGTFRMRGDVVEVCPASEDERSIRIEFFGDEIEELAEIDRLSGRTLRKLSSVCIYPASHFVTSRSRIEAAIATIEAELMQQLEVFKSQGKILEAARLEQRTLYDLELLDEMGFCPGIENYSRHLTGRKAGEAPPTLIDYFPQDFLVFIDESHATVPQLVGMYRGDRARKQTLVDYGFRLPSALDNRPLRFDEFQDRVGQAIYVSATPAEFEMRESAGHVVEQIIRPTGLLDPQIVVRPASTQVEDFLEEVRACAARGDRALVTVLTKRMAEHLTKYYQDLNLRAKYLHADIHTLDRVELIRGLREGAFDLLIGINLLREGLDLPEVSLVGIFDADKEGFLRSERSLIQTIGRAARNVNSVVYLYADTMTDSIQRAIAETDRRRKIQQDFNLAHNITPYSVRRAPEAILVERDELEEVGLSLKELHPGVKELPREPKQVKLLIDQLRKEMFIFAKELQFEKAAMLRDQLTTLERYLLSL